MADDQNTNDKEQIQEVEKRMMNLMARLDQVDRGLLKGTIKRLKEGEATLEEWNRELNRFKTSADELASSLDYVSKSFRDTVAELSKSNTYLNKSKTILNQIDKAASNALAVRRGEQNINRKNTELAKQKIGQQKDDLQAAVKSGRLKAKEKAAIKASIEELDKYQKSLDKILKIDKQIEASIGNAAGLLKGVDKTLQKLGFSSLGVSEAFAETKRYAQQMDFEGKPLKGLQAMGHFSKLLLKNLAAGLSVAKLFELGILAVGKAMMFIDKTSGNLAKNLGISNIQARELISDFNEISMSTDNVFINTKNLSEAFGQLTQSLGVVKLASDAVLESQVKLTKQAGYTNEAAVELAKLGAIQNTDAEGLLSNFLGQSEALNIQNGLQINSKQLAESALKTSKATLLQLKGQGQSLAEAAFEAKKLGLELQQIEGIADSLLNIESSIAAEFEAEVMLGRQLNLERARYYALTNDIAGLAGEIRKEAGSANEFAKMNRIQAEGLAKAFGMSREAMGEMLYEQEALSKLSGKADENAQTRFNNLVKEVGLERAKAQLGNETLANQMASANVQERFTAAIEKIQTLFLNLAEPLMPVLDAFASIAGYVGGLVSKFTPFLSVLIKAYAVIKGIGLAFTGISKISALIKSLNEKDLIIQKTKGSITKAQNFYLKVREALLSKGFLKAKAAILLEKVGLLNARQRGFYEGRLNYFTKQRLGLNTKNSAFDKASLLSSIRKNVVEKAGIAIRKVKLALEESTLVNLIRQNAQRVLANTYQGTLNVLKGIQLLYQKLEIGNLIRSNALRAVAFFRGVGAMFVDVVKSFSKIKPFGALIGAAVATGLVAGAIALFSKKGNDVFSKPSGGSGYGDRMLLGPEGAISLNNKDTVIAGTNLFPSKKGDDVVSSPAGAVQMAPELDYNKLAAAIGGAVNNKQVTLSYTDFAQKTRPVFG